MLPAAISSRAKAPCFLRRRMSELELQPLKDRTSPLVGRGWLGLLEVLALGVHHFLGFEKGLKSRVADMKVKVNLLFVRPN